MSAGAGAGLASNPQPKPIGGATSAKPDGGAPKPGSSNPLQQEHEKQKENMLNPVPKAVNTAPVTVGGKRTPPAQQGTLSYNGEALSHPQYTRMNEASRYSPLYGDPMYPQGSTPDVHNIMPGDLLFRAQVQSLSMSSKKPVVLKTETSRGVFSAFNGLMRNMRISVVGMADTQYITEESANNEKTGMRTLAVVFKGVRQGIAGEVFIPQGSRVMWGMPKWYMDPYTKQKRPFIGRVGSEPDAFKPVLYPMDSEAHGFGSFCGTVQSVFMGETMVANPLDGEERTIVGYIEDLKALADVFGDKLGGGQGGSAKDSGDALNRMARIAYNLKKFTTHTFEQFVTTEFKQEIDRMDAKTQGGKWLLRLMLLQAEVNSYFTEIRESRYVGKALQSGQLCLIDVQLDM